MKRIFIILILVIPSFTMVNSQNISANSLILKSIGYHDPGNKWVSFDDTLFLKQEIVGKELRYRKAYLNNSKQLFFFEGDYPEGMLHYSVKNNEGSAYWNGSKNIEDSIKTKYKVSNDRAVMYRDYYSFLYGMPMKLNDPGTLINSKVEVVNFHGKEYYKIKVNYEEEVGSDTWYFYFDKSTYALSACEFWKKVEGDGEYLIFEGIKEVGGLKLPAKIAWFITKDDSLLGTDILY